MSFAPISDVSVKLILLAAGVEFKELDAAIKWEAYTSRCWR
jgi:hypothetical protein